MNFKEVYNLGKKSLKSNNVECYNTDALYIFEECFGFGIKDLIIKGNLNAPNDKIKRFIKMIDQVIEGTPVQYVTGKCKFMNIDLIVGRGVLIPRDDTEVLVRGLEKRLNKLCSLIIFDLCSGSGAIAIALSKIFNFSEITAIELSAEAYKYLHINSSINGHNINTLNADIFEYCDLLSDESVDCIVSNPPYISERDMKCLAPMVKMEPETALNGGKTGLDFYYNICKKWIPKLKRGGNIAFEVGAGQSESVSKILSSYGINNIEIELDINNIPRAVFGIK